MERPTSQADWQALRESLTLPSQAWIAGRATAAQQQKTLACVSPIDGQLLTQIARCDQADVDLAVTAARQAVNQSGWSDLAPEQRKQRLQRWADLIEAHQLELALLETLDMGKPINFSLNVDLAGSVQALRWTAEAIDKWYGELAPTPGNQLGLISREPLGVVAAIVPWNFPLLMATWKFAPALAVGNAVILKPSERSPLTALRVASLAQEAGIPDGIFQVVPGLGHEAGQALARHPDVDCIAFTGSTQIAKQLLIDAGQTNMKRVWLEAGGKSPNLIFADAPNLKKAAKVAAQAIAFNQGQVCTAGSRLLLEASIHDDFIDAVVTALQAWQPSHPLSPDTRAGALVDQAHLEQVLKYVAIGQAEGAQLRCGGQACLQDTGGSYMQPTLFAQVDADSRLAQEEIFGPVLSVQRFETEAQAIELANHSIYGLAAGVWTQDLSRAHRVARALKAGSVWVNQYDAGDMTAPFGGYKQSGIGRDRSLHAFEKYTETKSTWIRLEV